MLPVDLLVAPRWLVPIEPAGAVLEHHALIVDAGRIVACAPLDMALSQYQPRQRLDLPHHAVLPGFVNAHTHAAMSLLRGIADDLPLMDWLRDHIWPAEGAHVSPPFCADGVRLAFAEMIRSGTTCVNDMYFFPDTTARVAVEVGLRVTVGLIALDFPTAWARDADEYLHKGLELHDAFKHTPLVRTIFAPHAPYTVSDAPLLKIRKYANELGIGIHMHVHETAGEVAMAVEATGKRPWQRLRDLELLGPDFIAVHMTQLSDEEIAQAAEYGVHVVHCPESNLKLASGFAPVGRLLKAGVNVALGTDGAASNNDLDLLGEMRSAALLAKAVAGDPQTLPAARALQMATLDGARALGLEHEIGSLTAGKSADFIAIDLSAAPTQPVYNVLSQLVYAASREQVTDVWVAGRALMRDRMLLTLDETAALSRAAEWRQKIKP
ncbi:Cytosine/adenosine deaminase [Fontimonas thermophila]|uniref:5-methylthioadenosine/S-adenosylhomocysteine deaminase n=1 Tax=Fontimonas thermophila TaxID=1076937 RepID=A0A1I2I058_9GAMM|nr:TRZ/ATZ family hydrolase [Fontimonas thermophila]SFF34407.1 Cytosine/adenosine deaminase [Fontimonas thermophila]